MEKQLSEGEAHPGAHKRLREDGLAAFKGKSTTPVITTSLPFSIIVLAARMGKKTDGCVQADPGASPSRLLGDRSGQDSSTRLLLVSHAHTQAVIPGTVACEL